eukprot:TRINITY_DN4906_c0_g2_i2.p1 TRINITY_DN4906_c0_g2~~TRINITY_DN4906_c0_g2_i2.p1  ORF type:complete len:443 (+),score=108.95 TRINITY_DN4906_c0_g2_i2:205-1533(+)
MSYAGNKTIADMFEDLDKHASPRNYHPRQDISDTIISMFFDVPLSSFESELERILNRLILTQSSSSFVTSSLQFSPIFLHQDANFLKEYFARNPNSEYGQAFLASKDIRQKHATTGALFKQLSENSVMVAETIHQLAPTDSMDRASLLSSFIRQSVSPDIVSNSQSSTDASLYEEKSINYVNKRQISSTLFDMIRSTMRVITSFAYPFYQQDFSSHVDEILSRYTSLLLGYGRPLSESERPSDKTCLDLDHIIPFLYRNRMAILDKSKHESTNVLGIEHEFLQSPLVQFVFRIARNQISGQVKQSQASSSNNTSSDGKDDDTLLDAHTVISQLYSLWEESKIHPGQGSVDLNNFIIKLLANERYSDVHLREVMKQNVEKSENSVSFWTKVETQVSSFVNFLSRYETVLNDPNYVLPENLSPIQSNTLHNQFDEDAQIPSEIF